MAQTLIAENRSLRRAVLTAAFLNLGYFGFEVAVAVTIRSVSLFADSVDFLEDAALNLLIFVGLSWSAGNRSRLGKLLSVVILAPGLATIWTAWGQLTTPVIPKPYALSITAGGALGVNLFCTFLLARDREHAGSLTRAAFLSARNDVIANLAMIAVGFATAALQSPWPDLIVGMGIMAINAEAALKVWSAAMREGDEYQNRSD